LNPAWDNTLQVTVSQPLLRGRGEEASAAELRLARANTAVTDAAFRAQVESVLLEVERAYWELVFAERDLQVKESSLALAGEQLERTRAQVEVGLLAPVEQTQAEVQIAARETDLIVTRNALENARDTLRAYLRAEQLPEGWDTPLHPIDDPEAPGVVPELDRAVALAMESRPEVQQGRALVAARAVDVAATRNGLLPRADLLAQLSTNGIGGDLIVRDGFPGEIVDVVPGGYGDAISEMLGLDYVSWRLGFNISVPLGNAAAEGRYAQATIHEDRAATELDRTRQQVVREVRQAWRGVQAAADAVLSTRKTRELASRQLEIETDRFDVGMSTNFEILQFQEVLAEARSAELRSLIDQRIAETQLQRAMGLLLDRYGITVQ
jgi:outer membrane protein TolC